MSLLVKEGLIRRYHAGHDWYLSENSRIKSSFLELVNFSGVASRAFRVDPKLDSLFLQFLHNVVDGILALNARLPVDVYQAGEPCCNTERAKVNEFPLSNRCYGSNDVPNFFKNKRFSCVNFDVVSLSDANLSSSTLRRKSEILFNRLTEHG